MSLNRVIKRLKIEMSGSTKQYQVSAKQHDRATRYVEVELLDNGAAYEIPAGSNVTAYIKKPDLTRAYSPCTFEGSVVTMELASQMFSTLYLYCECMLIGAIVANIIAAKHRPAYDKEYVIILGCGINGDGTPTPLLRGRIDKAIEFSRKQFTESGHAPLFITSGGQGPNEVISESESMKHYLVDQGISERRIIQEDKSTDTFENMKFSKAKLEEMGKSIADTKVAFSTTNYHVFRSGLYAKRVKLQAEGMGADTKWYFWPNASVRELVGLMTEHRGKQALVLLGMAAIYATLTILSFQF